MTTVIKLKLFLGNTSFWHQKSRKPRQILSDYAIVLDSLIYAAFFFRILTFNKKISHLSPEASQRSKQCSGTGSDLANSIFSVSVQAQPILFFVVQFLFRSGQGFNKSLRVDSSKHENLDN